MVSSFFTPTTDEQRDEQKVLFEAQKEKIEQLQSNKVVDEHRTDNLFSPLSSSTVRIVEPLMEASSATSKGGAEDDSDTDKR